MLTRSMIPSVTDAGFRDEVERAQLPVLVLFRSVWSGPSRSTSFALEEVAPELGGKVKVVEVDMSDNWEAAERYRVRMTPTLLVLWHGRELTRHEGFAGRAQIREVVSRSLALCGRPEKG